MGRKGVIVSVAIGVVVIGLGTWATLSFLSRREHPDIVEQSARLESVLAESKRLGFPMTASDLVAPVSDDQNAAIEAIPIMERISAQRVDTKVLRRARMDTKYAIANRRYEAAIRDLKPLYAALAKPHWQIRNSVTVMGQFSELITVRNVAQLLAYHAEVRASAGDVAGALAAVANGRRLVAFLARDPDGVKRASLHNVNFNIVQAIETLVEKWRASPERLDALADVIKSHPIRMSLRDSLNGDFYYTYHLFRNAEDYAKLAKSGKLMKAFMDRQPIENSKLDPSFLPRDLRTRANLTRYAEACNQVAVSLENETMADATWADKFAVQASSLDLTKNPSMEAAMLFLSTFGNTVDSHARHQVSEDLILALIAAARNPNQTPKLPLDPFNAGKPVQFQREGRLIRIWSYGFDRNDDRGFESLGTSGRDIVAVIPSAARRP